ncbi:hypothetical protein Plhal304r1_c031g0101461 [Plasmopara halstedii]
MTSFVCPTSIHWCISPSSIRSHPCKILLTPWQCIYYTSFVDLARIMSIR